MPEKTLFQKICDREVPASIVYEDEHCVAFHDINPQAPTHLVFVPRKPIPRIGAATPADIALLGHMMVTVGEIARLQGFHDNGFRVVINHGSDGGETVPHLHLHLLAGRPLDWPPG